MELLYQSALNAAVYNTIAAGRFYEKLMALKNIHLSRDPRRNVQGTFIVLSELRKSTVAGSGQLFTNYLQTRSVNGYTGQGQHLSFVQDDNYNQSTIQVMSFEEICDNLKMDITKRMLLSN